MAVVTVTMGVHYRWQIPDAVWDQLRLAHALREDLVRVQLGYDDAVKAIWSSYPAVAAAEQALAAAEDESAVAAGAVSAERVRQRTKRVTGPAADRLAAARAGVKQARQSRRDAIATVHPEATGRIHQAADELRAARKQLYATYCRNDTGTSLFWATHNDIATQHNAVIKRVKQQRAAGRPAQLRHHRFTGTGTIAVQLKRETGDPPRTPDVVADPAGKHRNVLLLPWTRPEQWDTLSRAEQRRHGRTTVRMRCATIDNTPVWVDIPVQQHHMLDPNADITKARLTVTRTAGHTNAHLTATAKIPDPTEHASIGPTVAIHLGWRGTEAGIQVATWRATAPLNIPTELRHVLAAGPEPTAGTVVMPHHITDRLAHTDHLRAQRDLALGAIRDKLTTWLTEHGPIPHPHQPEDTLDATNIARWRSPARFAALAHAWRNTPPVNGADIAAALEDWRRTDRARWEHQEHLRGKTLRHRNDLYRNIAAKLVEQAATIVIDDTSIATLAALPSDLPTEIAAQIAHRRTIAAPATLRDAITTAARRTNTPTTVVPAAGLSRTHANCGHENPSDDRYRTRPVPCDNCGANYDPETSATLLMLQRASR